MLDNLTQRLGRVVKARSKFLLRLLDLLGGMVYSEALLMAMVAKGADRQEAYRLVQMARRRRRRALRKSNAVAALVPHD